MKSFKVLYKDFFNWELGLEFKNRYESLDFLYEKISANSIEYAEHGKFKIDMLFDDDFWEKFVEYTPRIQSSVIGHFSSHLTTDPRFEDFLESMPQDKRLSEMLETCYTIRNAYTTRIKTECKELLDKNEKIVLGKFSPLIQKICHLVPYLEDLFITENATYAESCKKLCEVMYQDRQRLLPYVLSESGFTKYTEKILLSLPLDTDTKRRAIKLLPRQTALSTVIKIQDNLDIFFEIYPRQPEDLQFVIEATMETIYNVQRYLESNDLIKDLSSEQLLMLLTKDKHFSITEDVLAKITTPELKSALCKHVVENIQSINCVKLPKDLQPMLLEQSFEHANGRYMDNLRKKLHQVTGLGTNPDFCKKALDNNWLELAAFCMQFARCNNREDLVSSYVSKAKDNFDVLKKSKLYNSSEYKGIRRV